MSNTMEEWIADEGKSNIRRDLWRGYPLSGGWCIIADRVISKYEEDERGEKNYYRVLGYWTGSDADAMEFMKHMDAQNAALAQHKQAIRELVAALETVQADMRDSCPLSEHVCRVVDSALANAKALEV